MTVKEMKEKLEKMDENQDVMMVIPDNIINGVHPVKRIIKAPSEDKTTEYLAIIP